MPKVVFPDVVRVEPKIYNVLRSFLESSLKDDYPWNTGVVLPNTHIVSFQKPKKWILNINHSSAIIFSKDYKQVLVVERNRVTITVREGVYQDLQPDVTYVLPEPPTPYCVPLSLRQILGKLETYWQTYRETVPVDLKCYKECRTNC